MGGTWYWNRYPGARFDSESYTYAYLFSRELFDDWEWQEHFAEQPEIERYLNHVVDRFDLRRHIRFGAGVTSAVYHEASGDWTVATGDGASYRAQFFVAATGVLSVPYFPEVPGREAFRGESYHTGRWPTTPVDFAGKRVAVIGTGSSGVQVIPAIAGEVATLTVYQRSANWCTPLNNARSRPTSRRSSGPDSKPCARRSTPRRPGSSIPPTTADLRRPGRGAPGVLRDDVEQPRLLEADQQLHRPDCQSRRQRAWCEFIAEKIRGIVEDPETAERLIPRDHRFGEKRPPFVTGYYEAYNRPNVNLVDLSRTPIVRVTERGIETSDGAAGVRHHRVGHGVRLRHRGTGPDGDPGPGRPGPRPITGRTVRRRSSASRPPASPTSSSPAGRTPRPATTRATTATRSTSSPTRWSTCVTTATTPSRWTRRPRSGGPGWSTPARRKSPFGESSYYFGTNIPGKPRKYLLNSGGRPKLLTEIRRGHR